MISGCGDSKKTLNITPEDFAKNFNIALGVVGKQMNTDYSDLEIVSIEKGDKDGSITFKQKNYSGSLGGIKEGSNLLTIIFASENNPSVAGMCLAIPMSVPATREGNMIQQVASKILGENRETILKDNGVAITIGQDSNMTVFMMTTEENLNKGLSEHSK